MSTASPATVSQGSLPLGWIRSRTFDLNFVVTSSLVALCSGVVVWMNPSLVVPVLLLDLWLLGFHHVISTFTRLVFDRQSLQENRFLVVQLPLIVIAATIALASTIGIWAVSTAYLYWQWFHYTRQSYGIERAYRRKADSNALIDDRLSVWTLYMVPLAGIVYRSWQQSETFLGVPVWMIPVPDAVMLAVAGIAATVFLFWLSRQLIAAATGRLATMHFAYQISHHAIFITGYMLISDVTTGWLVLNVWHNIQYIMFVWAFNNKRFNDQIDPDRLFLSKLCQSRNVIGYLAVCLAVSTTIYTALTWAGRMSDPVPVALLGAMAINFHHYIVDGMIWKRRRAPQPTVGA